MIAVISSLASQLSARRRSIGMSLSALAARSGVPAPTVKRILGGGVERASFASIAAIAEALGLTLGLQEIDAEALCREQARRKAEQVARMVQGTSALESQAVDAETYRRLVERSYHELMAGPRRRLWSA